MNNRTDHEIHASRMQAILESKATDAALALAMKHARTLPPAAAAARIEPYAQAAQRAAERLRSLPLPAGPVTYHASTRANPKVYLITMPPASSLHALIRAAKAALGINTQPTEPPSSATAGHWTLRIRGTAPADFLNIAPVATPRPQSAPAPTVPPETALAILHLATEQRDASTVAARRQVDQQRRELIATHPTNARATYLARHVEDPDNPRPLSLPINSTRTGIAAAAARAFGMLQYGRLESTPAGAAIANADGRHILHIEPAPADDDLETDEHGNYIL